MEPDADGTGEPGAEFWVLGSGSVLLPVHYPLEHRLRLWFLDGSV